VVASRGGHNNFVDPAERIKDGSWAWAEQGHFHRGFKGSLHSKDIASVHETLTQYSHKDYLFFQHKFSFAAPLGLLHQRCVHRGAVQPFTATPSAAKPTSVPPLWVIRMACQGLGAQRRSFFAARWLAKHEAWEQAKCC
jgi:hypothetical protein